MRTQRHTVQSDGARIAVFDVGPHDGVPVVLLHGAALTHHEWEPQLALARDGFRCIALDQRGHGETEIDTPAECFIAEDYAKDIAAVLDALQLESAHVIGLSLGAIAGQQFAADYRDRCASLIAVGGPNDTGTNRAHKYYAQRLATRIYTKIAARGMNALAEVTARSSPRAARATTLQYLKEDMNRNSADNFRRVFDGVLLYSGRASIATISCPALFCAGAKDWVRFQTKQSAKLVPGAEFRLIAGAGHVANVDSPDGFNDLARQWLARQASR